MNYFMQKTAENLTLSYIVTLYRKYLPDLIRVRRYQKQIYRKYGYWHMTYRWYRTTKKIAGLFGFSMQDPVSLRPQLDDIEAEITYLLLREYKPDTVVEISPSGGWSTTWILQALKDNKTGRLYSFDLIDDSTKTIPSELSKDRWIFILGDIKNTISKLPKRIEYLFMDSDHSEDFAKWYVGKIFSKLAKGTPVSVHDVFHTEDPAHSGGEGPVVLSWLSQQRIPFFSTSKAKESITFKAICRLKEQLSLAVKIHSFEDNSMIFFIV